MQVSVSAGGAGLVGVAEALAALLCMNRGLQVSGCSSDISCQQRRQRAEPRRGRRRRGERDGREQLRDEQLRSPEMFGPFTGGEKHFSRRRGVEMDSTKRRRDVFFNNKTDAVSGSQIISVQTEPS